MLLEYCASLGDVIVGLNSDASVKRLKGSDRPVNDENARRFVLESLKFVSQVLIFEEDTPHLLISRVKPDLIVKGGDYNAEEVVGKDIAEVLIFPTQEGYSTSKIIRRMRS
jgi:D-beta-D-heptose 7-phosphate kinase/D-beta-D-heptose 1-phosphate adenosyltransferase